MIELKLAVKTLIVLSLIFGLSVGCQHKVPDEPICIPLTARPGTDDRPLSRGWCKHTMSDREFVVSDTEPWPYDGPWKGKTWWEIRNEMLLLPNTTYAELKKFIIKICKTSNQCTQKEVASWDRTIQRIDEIIELKGSMP